jgi:tetratricopeptide (TPR) repeat protein
MAEQFKLLAVQADCLITLGTFKGAGSGEAIPMLEEAVRIADSANLYREAMRANNNLGVLLIEQGNFMAALRFYQRASELARRTGNVNLELFFSVNSMWPQMFLGQLHEAEERSENLEELLEILPNSGSGGRSLRAAQVWLLFEKGDFGQALELVDQKIQTERESNDFSFLYGSLANKAHILLIEGRYLLVEEILVEAHEIALKFGEGDYQYLWASVGASKTGDVQKAAQYLEGAKRLIEESQSEFWKQVNLLRAEAHLLAAKNEWESAWHKFGDIQELLDEKGLLFFSAWFGTEWADAHLMRGEPENLINARELLTKVRNEFDGMGSGGWVELVDRKLAKIAELL